MNFILLNGPGEKPYEGAELFALYGNTTDSDAHVRQVYLRGGVTGLDGKVSIAALVNIIPARTSSRVIGLLRPRVTRAITRRRPRLGRSKQQQPDLWWSRFGCGSWFKPGSFPMRAVDR